MHVSSLLDVVPVARLDLVAVARLRVVPLARDVFVHHARVPALVRLSVPLAGPGGVGEEQEPANQPASRSWPER